MIKLSVMNWRYWSRMGPGGIFLTRWFVYGQMGVGRLRLANWASARLYSFENA